MNSKTIAVVDDEASIREYLEVLFSRRGYEVFTAASLAEFKSQASRRTPDLVISDMKLGADSGLEVLAHAKGLPQPPEVVIITAYGSPSTAVEAMRRGAYDYICKPFDNDELVLLAERALEKRGLVVENRRLKADLGPPGAVFAGSSPAMKEVWSLVDKVAQASRTTVLITGESGTGKEVIARAIHQRSSRALHPFVAINCAALAESVLESELFGHVKGSFTGAISDRVGILVSAGEGTVLLDEVGELSPATQLKLLRVLQERTVKPVGSSREVHFEARVLAATNRNMEEEVKAGRFREDLLFRLNVIGIELPPLRRRREDLKPLSEFILRRLAGELGRPGLRLSTEALALIEAYPFTGNVRQLQNVLERAATLSDSDVLGPDSLPPAVRGGAAPAASVAVALTENFSLERHLDEIERVYLEAALQRADGVKTRAAELVGLSFRSFRYRLAKHGLGERGGGEN